MDGGGTDRKTERKVVVSAGFSLVIHQIFFSGVKRFGAVFPRFFGEFEDLEFEVEAGVFLGVEVRGRVT